MKITHGWSGFLKFELDDPGASALGCSGLFLALLLSFLKQICLQRKVTLISNPSTELKGMAGNGYKSLK